MKSVLNGFANIGTVEDNSDLKELQNRNSNEITMGNGVPRQIEGKTGDITVREIPGAGIKVYIKTSFGGWYDINSLDSQNKVNWIKLNLENSWVHSTDYNEPGYWKDQNGFVHLRGGVYLSSGGSAAIATLPLGYRPVKETRVPIAQTDTSGDGLNQTCVIATNGEINFPNNGGATSFLDGISFYAVQTAASSTGGGRNQQPDESDVGGGGLG